MVLFLRSSPFSTLIIFPKKADLSMDCFQTWYVSWDLPLHSGASTMKLRRPQLDNQYSLCPTYINSSLDRSIINCYKYATCHCYQVTLDTVLKWRNRPYHRRRDPKGCSKSQTLPVAIVRRIRQIVLDENGVMQGFIFIEWWIYGQIRSSCNTL